MAKKKAQKNMVAPHSEPQDSRMISSSEFKTHCLELMERIGRTREEITVTRYGKPIAKMIPIDEAPPKLLGCMKGSVVWYDDIISPVVEPWDPDADQF